MIIIHNNYYLNIFVRYQRLQPFEEPMSPQWSPAVAPRSERIKQTKRQREGRMMLIFLSLFYIYFFIEFYDNEDEADEDSQLCIDVNYCFYDFNNVWYVLTVY